MHGPPNQLLYRKGPEAGSQCAAQTVTVQRTGLPKGDSVRKQSPRNQHTAANPLDRRNVFSAKELQIAITQ